MYKLWRFKKCIFEDFILLHLMVFLWYVSSHFYSLPNVLLQVFPNMLASLQVGCFMMLTWNFSYISHSHFKHFEIV